MSEEQTPADPSQKLPWTDERVELLKKMWAEGLSASQIAGKLAGGVTRNAVIGKVHRMGLSGRVTRARVSTPRTRKTREPSHPGRTGTASGPHRIDGNNVLKPLSSHKPDPIIEPVPIHIADIPVGERVTILMLSDKTCRWPLGDPGSEDFCFCGKPPREGAPYCPGHAAMAYQPARERRSRTG
ncbi:MAG: GcrA family cell cycle regulator [Anderseniella sp.]